MFLISSHPCCYLVLLFSRIIFVSGYLFHSNSVLHNDLFMMTTKIFKITPLSYIRLVLFSRYLLSLCLSLFLDVLSDFDMTCPDAIIFFL